MFKKIFLLFSILLGSWIGQAHEFWLQPDRFRYKPGDIASVNIRVGENFMGDPYFLKKARVVRLGSFHLEKFKNLQDKVNEGNNDHLKMEMKEEGTHLVIMETNAAFIKLDGEKFNSYLKEDGLDEAYEYRVSKNILGDSAKEFYSRHTKLLLQVGMKTDDTYKKVAGFPIEIVPVENPYTLKIGDRIHLRILYDGKPLFGAKAAIFNRYKNRTTVQNIYTQQDGIVETTISNGGSWMVNVVKMIPSTDPGAHWRSYWGSLVFGI